MELFTNIVVLLVGSAVFLTGMNMMSSGLKKIAGRGMKKLFSKIREKRLAGFGIGAAVTAIIQSSAATSVMVVGFINAGVMTIFQGLSIIMGAYLGTTVTGLLVSLSTFKLSTFLMLLGFIGIILTFINKPRIKHLGEILCGLGLLFFGLENMSQAFKYVEINNFCQTVFANVSLPLLLLVIGALFTMLVQSSSATTGIVIVMVGAGTIDIASAFYVALGATVGTVITTLLATIGGTTNAKRTAYICLIMRAMLALITLAIVWPLNASFSIIEKCASLFPNYGLFVAVVMVVYNVVTMLATMPFIRFFERASIKLFKDKEAEKQKIYIKYIDDKLLDSPAIAMMQVKKEILSMYDLACANFKMGYIAIVNQDFSGAKIMEDVESGLDYINNRITDFLINLSHKVEIEDERIIGGYFHIINDIERIGDHAYNFLETSTKMKENDLAFSDVAKNELQEMYNAICEMFNIANDLLDKNNKEELVALHELENKTDILKQQLADAHFDRITHKTCHIELSPFYSTFISELERVADHLTNIGYAYVNPTGDEE